MNERDDTAVRAVLDQVYAAFAANDADAYVTAYADTVSTRYEIPRRSACCSVGSASRAGHTV
jgi:hypothetical protein